jgi:hypothetical protein
MSLMTEESMLLYNLTLLQIHGSTGKHTDSTTVRANFDFVVSNVFCGILCYHGNVLFYL